MDYHKILSDLIEKNTYEAENFNSKLEILMEKALNLLPEEVKNKIISKDENVIYDTRYQYLRSIVYVLQALQKSDAQSDDTVISVNQFRTIKIAIELIISLGIVPYLLPGVGIDMSKLCPRAMYLCKEELTEMEKYERLKFSATHLVEFYHDVILRPTILSHINSLLTALLQLSCAPLMKPTETNSSKPLQGSENKFVMTVEMYKKLKIDQEEFYSKLNWIMENCPQSIVIKELMVILGLKNAPKWLRKVTQKYLTDNIVKPNGIISLIGAVCNDTLDLGADWTKLDTVVKLIAVTHGKNPDEYYKSISTQLLHLLASKNIKNASTLANYCITELYNHNPEICKKYILEKIFAPLTNMKKSVETKNEIEDCIDNLTKCFVTVEAKFKYLPCQLLSMIAVPLFCLHNKIRQSAFALKAKIKQLLLRLLYEENLREKLYRAYLGHNQIHEFGEYVEVKFKSDGIEIVGKEEICKYEEYTESLLDLVMNNELLSNSLFIYTLKSLPELNKQSHITTQNLLETPDDTFERLEKQCSALKLLSSLTEMKIVQEAQFKNPENLFSYIKSLFNNQLRKMESSTTEEDECEILYTSLMLVKLILIESKKPSNWTPFDEFAEFLKKYSETSKLPSKIATLIKEVIDVIETYQDSVPKHFEDLSVDNASSKFEEAVRDLADPLLPVRAHGLITLTKLIETKDPCATARKAVILQFFQENLKHEDSFIYLAAINGLCSFATMYPQVIIETLVQEFTVMPQRISSREISSETRIKLGEILVKTTRGLGEMAAAYKNILVNGFLCAIRDSDPLVRASSLSCLGELCKVLGFRLGNILIEVIYCITCIIQTDKTPECRRAAVMVAALLLRGLGKDVLTSLGSDLVNLFRGLKHLRDNDNDPVVRLHAQLAMEEFNDIVQKFLFSPPKLEKTIFLLE